MRSESSTAKTPFEERERVGAPLTTGGIALYALLGTIFGFILVKGEVISWFRIQEMFRFQGFHMYGVFAGALVVAIPALAVLRAGRFRSLSGEGISIPPKISTPLQTRYWAGGALFGIGWALTGACPGPLYALFGSGVLVFIVPIAFALLGTWLYGSLRRHLPH